MGFWSQNHAWHVRKAADEIRTKIFQIPWSKVNKLTCSNYWQINKHSCWSGDKWYRVGGGRRVARWISCHSPTNAGWKPEGNTQLGRQKTKHLSEIECEDCERIHLAQEDQWRVLVTALTTPRLPQNAGSMLTTWETISFSSRILLPIIK